ncbi:hypothetical protein [Dialister invisus]|uniref:hypothetical protein n=1 Tax=Dialister invisus TaxID=218538 RepID=UPI002F91EB1A
MTLNVYLIMMPFPPIVILNRGKNALWERRGNGNMTRSEESITFDDSLSLSSPRPQIFRTAQDDA